MQNITIPAELKSLVPATKTQEVEAVIQKIFAGTSDWKQRVEEIIVKDHNDKIGIEMAKATKLAIKKARLEAEKLITSKREQVQALKAEFDLEDKLWLKASQIMALNFKAIEEIAERKAKTKEIWEEEQKRIAKEEAEKKAELERIAKEKAEAEAKEKERLKAEAEAKALQEKQKIELAKQKAEADRLAKELEKTKAKAEQERQKAEQERQKAQAQAKAEADKLAKQKAEAEARAKIAEAQLKAQELAKAKAEQEAKKEAEARAKEPIKKQLQNWVKSFALPNIDFENETTWEIKEKFKKFVVWAKNEIENI